MNLDTEITFEQPHQYNHHYCDMETAFHGSPPRNSDGSMLNIIKGRHATRSIVNARRALLKAEGEDIGVSCHQEGDKYDYLGRNVSVQQRRQELEPWVLIEYKKSKS